MKKWISFVLMIVLLAACAAAAAEEEWSDYHCEEEKFTTTKPYHALTQYKNNRGYVGITFYLDVPGAPPYVMVHRRAPEKKLSNPRNYLNNTYREFLEGKYTGSVATGGAGTVEIGGKQLIGAKYIIGSGNIETTQLQLIETRDLGDVEYIAMFSGAEEEALTMKALEAAVAGYTEDEAQKTGTASGSGTGAGETTEQDLMTLWLEDDAYILGKSTPEDLIRDGWNVSAQRDGTFAVGRDYLDGVVYVATENGSMDKPILQMNAFWADEFSIEYCGFDGIINPGLAEGEDPDQRWNRDYPYEVLVNAWEDDSIHINRWGAMCTWLTEVYGAKESEEGIYEAEIPLSDGRTLYVSSHDSPVCISLIP